MDSKYYFCVSIPYEGYDITEYDSLEELEQYEAYYTPYHNDWFIIKGNVIKKEGE